MYDEYKRFSAQLDRIFELELEVIKLKFRLDLEQLHRKSIERFNADLLSLPINGGYHAA